MGAYSDGRLAIACCQRCFMTFPYTELVEDGNIKGFYVCKSNGCYDEIDPYKLPPRPPDAFVLHHPRPDLPLTTLPDYWVNLVGDIYTDENGYNFIV